jgi:hypothetical protein
VEQLQQGKSAGQRLQNRKLIYNMKPLFIFFFCFSCFATYSQKLEVSNDIDFVLNKIDSVYAGDKALKMKFFHRVRKMKSKSSIDTFSFLSNSLYTFLDNHLKLYQPYFPEKIDSVEAARNLNKINLNGRKNKFEGYWINNLKTLIIYIVKGKANLYEGYAIESVNNVPKGLCVLKTKLQKDGPILSEVIETDTWYRVVARSYLKNDSILVCNSEVKWRKMSGYKPAELGSQPMLDIEPALISLNENTILLKMHSFGASKIKVYDSIIKTNKALLAASANLIIDIRNNLGGVVNCFDPLLPFLGSGVIVGSSGRRYISSYLVKDVEFKLQNYIKNNDSNRAVIYARYLDKIKSKVGTFLEIGPDTLYYSSVDSFPNLKNIALITDNATLSAAELMVAYFKQSNKVKIFGESTGGFIDFLDVHRFKTPIGKYNLLVPTTKRNFTNLMPSYDATGIKPDIPISDDIEDWVQFVKSYYEKH